MSYIKLLSQNPLASSIGPMDTLLGNVVSEGRPSLTSRFAVSTLTEYITSKFSELSGGNNAQLIQSRDVSSNVPVDGQSLVWSETNNQWEPQTVGSPDFLSGQNLTVSYIPLYSGPNTLIDSQIQYDGTNTIIHGDTTVTGNLTSEELNVATLYLSGIHINELINTVLPITADVTIGSISPGEVIAAGVSLQEFAEQLLIKTFYPTYIAPTAPVITNLSPIVESGTKGITLTTNLNRGSIVGKTVNGIWNPSLFLDFRSGEAITYVLSGVDNGPVNFLEFPDSVIQDGPNTYESLTTYDEGPQPVDSKQNNFENPLPSGALITNVTVTGARKAFYGVDNPGLSSENIRLLGSSTSPNVTKGATFSITIPSGSTSVVFAYPASLGNVASVKYVEGLNLEVKLNFIRTTVLVEGANNYTGIDYNVYRYAPTGYGGAPEPFSATVTYTVTI